MNQPSLEDQVDPGISTTLKTVRSSVTNSPREAAKRMPGTPSLLLLMSHPPPRATLSKRCMSPTHSSQTLPSTSYKPYLLAFPPLPTSSGFARLITASSHAASPLKCCHWVSVGKV